MPGFGSGGWGSSSWGAGLGGGGAIAFTAAIALRENVIRLSFSEATYFSGILDTEDASRTSKYAIAIVPDTVGADGSPVRVVTAIRAERPASNDTDLPPFVANAIIDLILDRPMTPYPARYTVTVTDIFKSDLTSSVSGSISLDAAFKKLQEPTIETAIPSRDIANPQTKEGAEDPLPNPNTVQLGTIQIDDTGDYAFDEGIQNLKKRILRRLVTTPGAFAHLPGYGVGIPDFGKKLAVAGVLTQLASAAETQILREPDVAKVRVRPLVDPNVSGLVRFQVLARPKTGQPLKFDVPFNAG